MTQKQTVSVFSGLAAGLALFALAGCSDQAKVQNGPYLALGETTARATSDLLGGRGRISFIVSEADNNTDTAAGQALKAFKAALKKAGTITITATETAPAPGLMLSGVEPLPAAKFIELVQKHATDDAVVSFMGVPRLSAEQIAQLPNPRPKLIAAMTFNPPSKALFAQGILQLAVIPRLQPGDAAAQPKTTAEWFDSAFQLITPETAGALPY